MQLALFLAAPTDRWRAQVVLSKWVGFEREAVAYPALPPRRPDVVVLVATSALEDSADVLATALEWHSAGVPAIGVDASKIRDEEGQLTDALVPIPELDRWYLWNLDGGEDELVEWIDYEVAARGTA